MNITKILEDFGTNNNGEFVNIFSDLKIYIYDTFTRILFNMYNIQREILDFKNGKYVQPKYDISIKFEFYWCNRGGTNPFKNCRATLQIFCPVHKTLLYRKLTGNLYGSCDLWFNNSGCMYDNVNGSIFKMPILHYSETIFIPAIK